MQKPGKLPPLSALKTFEAAARNGSFSLAAEELHVTHSAVSHQIRSLEEQLGIALFSRQGRRVSLTEDGRELAEATNLALHQLSAAIAAQRRRRNPNRLSVSVMPSFAGRWLAPRIVRFIDANPGCEVNIMSSTELVDFARDAVDLCIRWGPGGYAGVRAELLMDDTLFPVASPRVVAGRLPLSPAELAGLPLIRAYGEDWQPWFRAAGLDLPEPSSGLMLSDSGLVVQAAIEGHGVALARRSLAANALRSGELLRLFDIEVPVIFSEDEDGAPVWPPPPDAPQWRYWLVQPERERGTPLLARFLAWLRAEVEADIARPLATV